MITHGVFNDESEAVIMVSSRTVITQGVFNDESEAVTMVSSRTVITQVTVSSRTVSPPAASPRHRSH